MKISLVAGVMLLVIGVGAALAGIFGVGAEAVNTVSSGQAPFVDSAWSVALPLIGGLSLAIGGVLIGLSMGNWRHPRSHSEPGDAYVDPEGHHKVRHV